MVLGLLGDLSKNNLEPALFKSIYYKLQKLPSSVFNSISKNFNFLLI